MSDPKNREQKTTHRLSVDDVLAEAQSMRLQKEKAETKPAPQPQKPEAPMPAPVPPTPEIQSPVRPEMPMPAPTPPGQDVRFAQPEPPAAPAKTEKTGKKKRGKKSKSSFEESEDIYYGLQLKTPENDQNAHPESPTEFSYLFEDGKKASTANTAAPQTAKPQLAPKTPAAPSEEHRPVKARQTQEPVSQEPQQNPVAHKPGSLPDGAKSVRMPGKQQEPIVRYISPKVDVLPDKLPAGVHAVRQADKTRAKPVIEETPVENVLRTIEEEVQEKIPAIYHHPDGEEKLHKEGETEQKPTEVDAENPDAAPEEKPLTEKPAAVQAPAETQVKTDRAGKPLYAAADRPVHVMETNWLVESLLSEARQYTNTARPARRERTPAPAAEAPAPVAAAPVPAPVPAPARPAEQAPRQAEPKVGRPVPVPAQEPPEEPYALEPELDRREYEKPDDAPAVASELRSDLRDNKIRMIVTGACTALLLIAGFLSEYTHIGSLQLRLSSGPIPYLTVNLVFLLVAVVISIKSLWNGIRGLGTLQANEDSGVAVAAFAALMQSVTAFFYTGSLMSAQLHLYSTLAAGALFLNALGKVVALTRVEKNLKFVVAPEPKYAVDLIGDTAMAAKAVGDYVPEQPVVAYQHKTGFLSRFIGHSFSETPGESLSRLIAPIGLLASLILLVASLLMYKSFPDAITAFAAAACICVPFANVLCANLPLGRLCTLARKWGGMAAGYSTVEAFSQTNAVMLDDDDLFPKGTVEVDYVKSFGSPQVEAALLDAAALICAVGGPLSGVFSDLLKDRKGTLPKIERPAYEDGLGISGWASGRRVLVGSRELLSNYEVELPPREVETKYLQKGKQIAYIAVGNTAVALLVITYRADKRRAAELMRMERNGFVVLVRTRDFNITSGLIASCFEVDGRIVRVLPEGLRDVTEETLDKMPPQSEAMLALKAGRPMTMLRLLAASVRQKSNITIAVLLQIIAVVLGFVLVAFMACYSGLDHLRTSSLLLYELFWVAAVVLIPMIRKP